jgi:transposase-like protein
MDATHSITTEKNTILYTLLIRHKISGKGVPISYMITNDHSRLPISRWLSGLKDIGMVPLRITVDCSIPEINAIGGVFVPSTTIQLCLFHVSRTWNTNLKSKVKGDSPRHNKILWGIIMGELKSIMYEKSVHTFNNNLEIFYEKWSNYAEFINYFKNEWGTDEKKKMWSAAFQPEIFTNMATNNYIESWHNQLKSTYLKRQRNRRIDRLIYILTEDVAIDLKMDLARLTMIIGKLSYNIYVLIISYNF